MVIGMETPEKKSDRGPFLEKIELVASSKHTFFVKLEFKIDGLIGFENDRMKGLVSFFASDEVQGADVVACRFVRFLFVASHHIDVEHADHFFKRQDRIVDVVRRANEADFLGCKPHKEDTTFGFCRIGCDGFCDAQEGRRA